LKCLAREYNQLLKPWNTWRPRRRITRSGESDHPGQHSETPSLLKIQKTKVSRASWRAPVSSPRALRLQWP
uniref:Uncharacterized protein n=1 Tax=Astyanax mexicanus TaxID=7994 RepID=A0A3B1JK91_ASTMX